MADIRRLTDDVDRWQDPVASLIGTAVACCAGGRPHNDIERAHRPRLRDGLPSSDDGAGWKHMGHRFELGDPDQ